MFFAAGLYKGGSQHLIDSSCIPNTLSRLVTYGHAYIFHNCIKMSSSQIEPRAQERQQVKDQ